MTFWGYTLAEVRKALVGGLVPAAALLRPDLADGALSRPEVGGLVAAFLSGAVLVFVVKNRDGGAGEDSTSSTADPGSSLY